MTGNPLTDSVGDYLDYVKARKSPATSFQTRWLMETVFLPWAAKEELTDPAAVTDQKMDRYTASFRDRAKPLSDETIRSYVRGTRTYLNWAGVQKGKYKQPKKPHNFPVVLTKQDIQAMDEKASDERDRLIVATLWSTGIRSGELRGLRLGDLRATSDRQYFVMVDGKTGMREVAIPGNLFRRLKFFAENPERDFIFVGKRRRAGGDFEQLSANGLDQMIRNLAEAAGIKKRVYPNLFRHSYITNQIIQGTNLIYLRLAVGHTTLSQISETYAHVNPKDSYDQLMAALK